MLDLINAYENYLTKVKQASANTVSSYIRDIRQFSAWLSRQEDVTVLAATQVHIGGYLDHLRQDGRSAATVSRSLASLKNFYQYAVSTGFLEESPVTVEIYYLRTFVLAVSFASYNLPPDIQNYDTYFRLSLRSFSQ